MFKFYSTSTCQFPFFVSHRHEQCEAPTNLKFGTQPNFDLKMEMVSSRCAPELEHGKPVSIESCPLPHSLAITMADANVPERYMLCSCPPRL